MNVNIGKIENSRIYFEENDGRRRQIPVPAELPMQSDTPAREESPACQKSVLLFVITGVELKALLLALEKSGKKTISAEKGNLRYIKTKGFAGTVYICQSQMGAVGPASVMNTLALALEALQPARVIMCGIAFGFNEKKYRLGDVVVSRQVWSYEPAKLVKDRTLYRGDKTTASGYLLQCFSEAAVRYEMQGKADCQICQGTYASGEKLVNDKDFRETLLSQEPELSAGDMEAAGLVSVCTSRRKDWIVVKGISDLGYQKEDAYQETAAGNAADFVVFTLEQILFAENG
ncbi:MAG: 5'-methylthioadenosine/S-adenosylhomocysteine nucleosidase [Lachnospiraceae bacterium]|nr:5'-methylthioadenosine/S-adenosylhomocysteine nucleosidase [Lachnospiraceae bacterium]